MKTLNKITLAGLIFLGANTIETKAQYSLKEWILVTESEFNRLKIPEDSMQIVDLTKNKDSSRYTDNSKRGKKFTDINGEKYFWVNPNPTGEIYSFDRGREISEINNPKVEENKLTEEQQLEALVNDPEIKNLIKDFNSSFQVEFPYAYLGEDITDKTGHLWKKGYKTIIPVEIQENYPNGIILRDKKTSKDVLLIEISKLGLGRDLESFLSQIENTGNIKNTIKRFIRYPPGRKLNTLEEKKDFIRPYFTDSIPNAIKNLPKYKAPLIYKEEWLSKFTEGKSVNIKNNIKLDSTKPAKSIEMNEQKLDEILKGE